METQCDSFRSDVNILCHFLVFFLCLEEEAPLEAEGPNERGGGLLPGSFFGMEGALGALRLTVDILEVVMMRRSDEYARKKKNSPFCVA